MLEESVARQGEPLREEVHAEQHCHCAYSDNYIADPYDRLRIYKALSSAQTNAEQQDVELEMRDRYGSFPFELETFVSSCSAFLSH